MKTSTFTISCFLASVYSAPVSSRLEKRSDFFVDLFNTMVGLGDIAQSYSSRVPSRRISPAYRYPRSRYSQYYTRDGYPIREKLPTYDYSEIVTYDEPSYYYPETVTYDTDIY